MPKSRNHTQSHPQKRKRIQQNAQLRNYAARITNQQILDHCLMAERDTLKRLTMYQQLKPYLKFKSHFPTLLTVPGLVTV